MILRPYQTQAVADCLRLLRAGRRPVVVAPTGSGKTVLMATVAAAWPGRVLWLAHRRELIAQARAKLPPSVGVLSVQKRTLPVADLIIVDEAHHSTAPTYRNHIDRHTGALAGCTATPFRLDGEGLGQVFDELVVATTTAELIRDGVLIEPRYYSVPGVDTTRLRKRGGDFRQDDAEKLMDRPAVVGCAIREYRKHSEGERAVAFCVTVAHAQHVAEAFRLDGIPAEVVSGVMKESERDAVLSRLSVGATRVVANCMVLTEGWDLPSLRTAIILRPTASLCLHLQMIGRIMRSSEGKDGAVVLDHAGNYKLHGMVTDPIAFSLEGKVKKTGETGLKTCPSCYAIVPNWTPYCVCGFSWVDDEDPIEEQNDLVVGGLYGDDLLVEIATRGDAPADFASMSAAWMNIDDERRQRGYRDGWASVQFKNRFGKWPIFRPDRTLVDPTSREAPIVEFHRIIASGKPPRSAWGIVKSSLGVKLPWRMVIDAEAMGPR